MSTWTPSWLPDGIDLRLHGEVTSAPYVRMTLDLLRRVGVSVEHEPDLSRVRVAGRAGRGLPGFDLDIEPDASAAAFFWAAGMLLPGWTIGVEGVPEASCQGDARLPEVLARMGGRIERHPGSTIVHGPARIAPIDVDLADMPDAAMALAVVASFADGPSTIRGLRTLRVKETDRIAALRTELGRLGVRVVEHSERAPGVITLTPPPGGVQAAAMDTPVAFDTYDDHRMAMSLALLGLRRAGVLIRDPACAAKTYPAYWRELSRIARVGAPGPTEKRP
ncbi:hypothetical protein J4558_09705 [Leptolyngbya sp. 15MV]|nr:hypothetical protein J4558_09705 [Leptolyngbya sp. 15MV]